MLEVIFISSFKQPYKCCINGQTHVNKFKQAINELAAGHRKSNKMDNLSNFYYFFILT